MDECDLAFGVANCSQVCEDTVGSFQCSCEEGFLLEPDNESCAGNIIIIDLLLHNKSNCSHILIDSYLLSIRGQTHSFFSPLLFKTNRFHAAVCLTEDANV